MGASPKISLTSTATSGPQCVPKVSALLDIMACKATSSEGDESWNKEVCLPYRGLRASARRATCGSPRQRVVRQQSREADHGASYHFVRGIGCTQGLYCSCRCRERARGPALRWHNRCGA